MEVEGERRTNGTIEREAGRRAKCIEERMSIVRLEHWLFE
jgi:hypothetical protein